MYCFKKLTSTILDNNLLRDTETSSDFLDDPMIGEQGLSQFSDLLGVAISALELISFCSGVNSEILGHEMSSDIVVSQPLKPLFDLTESLLSSSDDDVCLLYIF